MKRELLSVLFLSVIGCMCSCTPADTDDFTDNFTDNDEETVTPPLTEDTVSIAPQPISVDLHMMVLTEWGLRLDVPIMTRSIDPSPDSIRFIVSVQPEGSDTVAKYVYRQKFDKEYVVNMELLPGQYSLNVWADYMVQHSGTESPYYSFPRFGEVSLKDTAYTINHTDKDAFCGAANIIIDSARHKDSLSMTLHRPFARVQIVLCDTTQLLQDERKRLALDENAAIDLSTYRARLYYQGFLPSAYDLKHDKPNDSRIGITSDTSRCIIDKNGIIVAYDYIFTNNNKGGVSIGAELYDPSGAKAWTMEPMHNVPVMRNSNTFIKIG